MTAKYKSLDDLVAKIQTNHEDLLAGKLDEHKLDTYIQDVQELQERLVIMRFKAYEEALEKTTAAKPEMQIDLRNQISLIDAIEEEVKRDHGPKIVLESPVVKEEKPTKKKAKKERKESKPAPTSAPEPEATPVAKNPAPTPEKTSPSPIEETIASKKEERSLNDKLSEDVQGTSLNERLKKTPIDNLPKAIGINQKYLFINELFNQNADHFNQVIAELDACANYQEALTKVKGELVPNYNWEEDNKHVQSFMDLVERRHLN